MKPLIVLLSTFVIAIVAIKLVSHDYNVVLSARIAMSVMLIFTAISHFVYTRGMALMIPSFLPLKKELVYITGIIEIVAAVGLLIPSLTVLTAWLLILFFLILLPANINAAIKRVDFQHATSGGPGTNYLWFRVPLQLFFICWTYASSINLSLLT